MCMCNIPNFCLELNSIYGVHLNTVSHFRTLINGDINILSFSPNLTETRWIKNMLIPNYMYFISTVMVLDTHGPPPPPFRPKFTISKTEDFRPKIPWIVCYLWGVGPLSKSIFPHFEISGYATDSSHVITVLRTKQPQ
jgi:hypothetical protein